MLRRGCTVVTLLGLLSVPVFAAELQPRTVAAFNHYVRVTEERMNASRPFLWVDTLPGSTREERLRALRKGDVAIERLETRDGLSGNRRIDVPDGLLHHWVGVVFVPGVRIDAAVALLQDYDRHAQIYTPVVARSKLLARDGDRFRVSLRFAMKKVVTVIVNSEHDARFTRPGPDRAQSRIYSTRIAEVEDPDTPNEHEKPVGRDSGYLWRLYSYWRFLERDGGTYVQCESLSLTRAIPPGLGWLVGPFVTSLPRESLAFTLETTRAALAQHAKPATFYR